MARSSSKPNSRGKRCSVRHLTWCGWMAGLLFAAACASTQNLGRKPQEGDPLTRLRNQIETILQDSSLSRSRSGVKIVSLDRKEVLYERNSQLLFHPASNMKLLTTATALSRLGPDFRFKTIVAADTVAIQDSAFAGNLYLKGFGNPDLSLDDLGGFARQLKQIGIRTIEGDLICDDSYFDDLSWGSGWMWDDGSSWFAASISALNVNDNCVTVTVSPGREIGDSLSVRNVPNTSYMQIENFGVTVDSLDSTRIAQFKIERKWRPPQNIIVVEGGQPVNHGEEQAVIDVVNPTLFAGRVFCESLEEIGIGLEGTVREGRLPDTTVVWVDHVSPPLTSVVLNVNKISDNLSAEVLLKTLGAELKGVPGTAEKGLLVVREFLTEVGVDTNRISLADGSGVSRYNVISPDDIVKLLQAMHADFRVQAEFKASLPIAGVDGTLEKRMKGTAAQGKLRAKTGSLRGVSSLSGYTTTADGELLAFSMIMEHFVVPTSKIRNVQDRIGAAISSFTRASSGVANTE